MLTTLESNNQEPHKSGQERRHIPPRIQLFFFFLFAMFCILLLKLAQLQMVEGPELAAREEQQNRANILIAPIRGNIYDSTGAPIASSISAHSLFYQYEVNKKPEYYIELAYRVEEMFKTVGVPGRPAAAEIIKLMDVRYDINGNLLDKEPSYVFHPRRIVFQLTNEEIAYFTEHKDQFPGFTIVEESTRYYHDYEGQYVASQLVGYVRPYKVINNQTMSYLEVYKNQSSDYLLEEYVGFDGLEFMYQEALRGEIGGKIYPVNARSEIIGEPEVQPPEKGKSLFLTINKDVQLATQKAIADHIAYMKTPEASRKNRFNSPNAVTGYAVAMEVETGRIVAMANYPDYNPNVWTGPSISTETYNAIANAITNGTIRDRRPNPKDLEGQPNAIHHPGSMVYPGSTLKPLTVLVGLAEKLITPSTRYYDRGIFEYGRDGSKVSNSMNNSFGWINAAGALHYSSNTFMAEKIGNALYMRDGTDALDIWDSYMKQFGLGVSTESGLPGENSGKIEYYDLKQMGSAQTALILSSFGQSAKYTTLQLAQYAAMLANRGKRMKPIFVDRITTYDGITLETTEPVVLNEVHFPDEFWDVIEEGMRNVNVGGVFDNVPYTVARKTGTSESDKQRGIMNAVFISYAPIEKPKLAVAVVVPYGGYGAYGAAPIARAIYDAYDKYVGLYDKPASGNSEDADGDPESYGDEAAGGQGD